MNTDTSLAAQLEATLNDMMGNAPDEVKDISAKAFAEIYEKNPAANALKTGDRAPDFTLPNAKGGRLNLGQALESGPVVLNFYRGGWCPFCNLEFRALSQALPDITALGARLIGISPETPDTSLSTAEKHALDFDVLSDVGNVVARQYGLLMQVPEIYRPLYIEMNLDVPACNGDDTWELPLPATYVVDSEGTLRGGYVDNDYTKRMEPAEIIRLLQSLNNTST